MRPKMYRQYAAITKDGRILAMCFARDRPRARTQLQRILRGFGKENALLKEWEESGKAVLSNPIGPPITQPPLIE